METKSVTF